MQAASAAAKRYGWSRSASPAAGSFGTVRYESVAESWLQHLRQDLATGEARREAEQGSEGGNKVGRFHGPIDNHVFPDPGAAHHHPCGSRIRVAGAVMLKAVAAGG